jgi:hypothetical protein
MFQGWNYDFKLRGAGAEEARYLLLRKNIRRGRIYKF